MLVKIKNMPFIFWALVLLVFFNAVYGYIVSGTKSVMAFGFCFPIIACIVEIIFASKHFNCNKNAKYWCLGILIVLVAVAYMIIFPPFTQPDSQYHYQSAYRYADVLLGRGIDDNFLTMRSDDEVLFSEISDSVLDRSLYQACLTNFSFFVHDASLVQAGAITAVDISANLPQVRIVSALGITLGILLHLGAFPTYYLGIVFGIVLFAVIVVFAVKITPIGKPIFAALAFLPMTLHLVSSYSYDTTIIALSFLLTAMLLRAIYSNNTFMWKEFVWIALLTILLAPCKIVYVLIALLAVFIPSKRFSSRRYELLAKSIPFVLGMLAIFVIKLGAVTSITSTESGELNYRGLESGVFYSLSDFIHNPISALMLYFKSFAAESNSWFITLIGGSLGWFQQSIVADFVVLLPFVICLIFSMIPFEGECKDYKIPLRYRATFIGIGLVVVVGVVTSMALGWTFNTEPLILGVQGRYFLPVMPLMMLACRPKELSSTKKAYCLTINAMILLNFAYVTWIYSKALIL